jgi:hypothetical protein
MKIKIKEELTRLALAHTGQGEDSFKKMYRYIWQNPRKKNTGGFRLTEEGYKLLRRGMQIKTYKIKVEEPYKLSNRTMIWIDQHLDSPYFLGTDYISVFKEDLAVILTLYQGDVIKYVTGVATSKKNKKQVDTSPVTD